MPIPVLKQGDSRWGHLPLGITKDGKVITTIASHGCTITCICMALAAYGITVTPAQVVERIRAKGGFAESGDLSWPAVEAAFPEIVFLAREATVIDRRDRAQKVTVDSALRKARNLLAHGQPVIMNVDAIGNDREADHFILAVGNVPGGDFYVHDPAYGEAALFSKRYGKPSDNLFGYASLIGDSGMPTGYQHALYKAAKLWGVSKKTLPKFPGLPQELTTYSKEIVNEFINA